MEEVGICHVADLSHTTGVFLPYTYLPVANPSSSALRLILGHGLGAKNPAATGYDNDQWIKLVGENAIVSGLLPIIYTARGHKGSEGWQESALQGDLDQFTWNRLSLDMFSLARDYFRLDSFVVGGSSMGSATALFCVMNNPPHHFKGLVLIRPPTAWETRKARKKFLISSARKCQQRNEEAGLVDDTAHLVLEGAANADLPRTNGDLSMTYDKILCPTLILAVRNDDAHPLETATQLHAVIAGSEMHVADSLDQARANWPALIQAFTAQLH